MSDALVPATETAPALELRALSARYGHANVLYSVDVKVAPGSVVALLGPNGAGKTTLLRVAAGLHRPSGGQVLASGEDLTGLPACRRARRGVCLIPEGRGVFRSLSVAENLRLALPSWAARTASTDVALEAFPVLGKRMGQLAGNMSGGEQQMLALARAYLSSPRVVLLDEVSMGLSPKLVDQVFEAISGLAARGVALLLVEQYVNRALALADKVVLLSKGSVSYVGLPSQLDQAALAEHYLGGTSETKADAAG